MAESIGALHASLSVGHAEFKADLYKARQAVQDSAQGMSSAMNKAKTSFDSTSKSMSAIKAQAIAVSAAIAGITLVLKSAASTAMRYESLGVVMTVVGKNAGYAADQLADYQKKLESTGISMLQARNAIIKMIQANLDLEKAQDLARAAQDAAVIANVDSSEAFDRMINGIQSGNTLILKNLGLIVDFEAAYKKAAEATGRTTTQLTAAEKTQIRMNAALDATRGIAGTYEASMGTVGKQISTLRRHIENLKIAAGEALLPGLAVGVKELSPAIIDLAKTIDENKEGITELFRQIVFLSTEAVKIIGQIPDFTRWMADSAAAKVFGIAGDDVIRLSARLDELKAKLKETEDSYKAVRLGEKLIGKIGISQDWLDSLRGIKKIREEIASVEKQLEFATAQAQQKSKVVKKPEPVKAPAVEKPPEPAPLDPKKLEAGQAAIKNLQRELALLGDKTDLEKLLWELQSGKYADLYPKDKQRVELLARELEQKKNIYTTEADKKKLADEIIKEVEALQRKADTYGMTAEEIKRYDLALKGASETQLEQVSALMQDLKVKEQVTEVLNTIRTPMEDYTARVRMLSDLLAIGAISQDEFTAAVKVAKDALKEAAKAEKKEFKALGSMIDSVTSDSADAIMEFARTGEFSVKKMVDAMISDLLRLSLQQASTSLAGGLKNVLGVAVTAIGGFLGSAQGNVFNRGELIPFARGGVVSQATVFPMARGMGLMGEAGPEAILPLSRTSAGELGVKAAVGGGAEEQTVNNYFVINSPDSEGFDRLCQRNAISIVRATNSALEKNVGRNQMKGLLGG